MTCWVDNVGTEGTERGVVGDNTDRTLRGARVYQCSR